MIGIRSDITIGQDRGINTYLPDGAINNSDVKEFTAARRYDSEVAHVRPARLAFDDLLFKSDFIRTFNRVKHMIDVRAGDSVLELGASHGWASTIIKDDMPDAYVVASDLVPECVVHAEQYETLLDRRLDEKWAFSVRDIPFADAQFDRIFTFAAFHHFGNHGDFGNTIAEIARILKPGGKLVLLYEPGSPRYLYGQAYRRANKMREFEGVDEDILTTERLRPHALHNGLSYEAHPYPIVEYRSSTAATAYYYLVSKLGLQRFLLCTTNIIMGKS